MGQVIKIKGVSIKAQATTKNGRKGYFIAASDLAVTKGLLVSETATKYDVRKKKAATKKNTPSTVRPEVKQLVKEMHAYKDGNLKARSFDEFIDRV